MSFRDKCRKIADLAVAWLRSSPALGWCIIQAIFTFLVRQILPFCVAVYVEASLRRGIIEESQTTRLNAEMEKCLVLDIDNLKESHQLEVERRDKLRRNAQLNLGASTLAVTIAFGLAKQDAYAVLSHWATASAAAIAVFFLISTALCALRANETMPVSDMWLQLRIHPFGRFTREWDEKAKFVKATYVNQGGNLIVANYAEASSILMRNAIIAIGIVLIIALYNGATETRPSSISPSVNIGDHAPNAAATCDDSSRVRNAVSGSGN